MTGTNPATRVLIVDQGVSFGGSALVAAVIVNRMPISRYEIQLAVAIPPTVLRVSTEALPRVHELAKSYNYVDQARTRQRGSRLPNPLRRARGWADLAMRFTRNAPYTHSIAEKIRRDRIDILHLNNGFENLEAHLAGYRTGCRIVVHAHGPCGRSRLTRRLARRARCCLAISQPVADSFYALGTPPQAVTLLPNPLTVEPGRLTAEERTRIRQAHGIPPDAVVAGSVGRIVEWKGQLQFLRAAAVALARVPEAIAVVVGDVTDDSEVYGRQLRQEAERLAIAHRVIFTGFIADPRHTYALLDVLVHSAIDPEPFGLVVTEAMTLGIPVIAAASGGPLGIVTDGVDGYLRDPNATAEVGEILAALLKDQEHRHRIGEAGRRTALTAFDPDRYVQRLAEVYDGLLAGPPDVPDRLP